MSLIRTETLWMPSHYDETPINKKNDRKLTTYSLTHRKGSTTTRDAASSKTRSRALNMSSYTIDVDMDMQHQHSLYYLGMNWTTLLTLKPYNSFSPKSMWNVLDSFKNEIAKTEGKNKQLRPTDWKYDRNPMFAVIEFGDKLGGIHSHTLLKTWLGYDHLESAWFNANLWGSDVKKLKLHKERGTNRTGYVEMLDLSEAENLYTAVRYAVAAEMKYSLIDGESGNTSFANDFVYKKFGDFKPPKQ